MAEQPFSRTSASLLGRLRREAVDAADWADFVGRYGPLIYGWCRRWKLQEADAEDVTQEVLAKLAVKLRTFRYDASQSFRAYIKTLSHYALCDFIESRNRPGAFGSGDSSHLALLDNEAARDELQERLSEAFDRELLEVAKLKVRARVEARTWEAFQLTAIEGLSGAEAASRTGMAIAATFKAKSKVQRMIREEIARLQSDEPEL